MPEQVAGLMTEQRSEYNGIHGSTHIKTKVGLYVTTPVGGHACESACEKYMPLHARRFGKTHVPEHLATRTSEHVPEHIPAFMIGAFIRIVCQYVRCMLVSKPSNRNNKHQGNTPRRKKQRLRHFASEPNPACMLHVLRRIPQLCARGM